VTGITILGQVAFDFKYVVPLARLAPTSWSLSIEVFCYCLLAFYFAKTPARLAALAAIGAAGSFSALGIAGWNHRPTTAPIVSRTDMGCCRRGSFRFRLAALLT
jgi:peptidoglycan/LPS O-acetylase OafA/YrhL